VKRTTVLVAALLSGALAIGTAAHSPSAHNTTAVAAPDDDLARFVPALVPRHPQRLRVASRSARRVPLHSQPTTTRRTVHPVSTRSVAGGEFASWINTARNDHGLRSLSYNATLASSARAHSSSMAANGSIYHSSHSQLWSNADRACSSCTTAGEIVGAGSSLRQVFDAFMADSVHRSVILDSRFRYFGVGIVYSRGSYWITEQFAG
jgi:uncharacterized protein YkwD